MSLEPGYGETPLPFEELDALLPSAREALEEQITKAAVYDLEQAIQASVAEELIVKVLEGHITLQDVFQPNFLHDLHRHLYGRIWQWAGHNRRQLLNIGIHPEYVAIELRAALDSIRYRWESTEARILVWSATPSKCHPEHNS